MGNNNHMPPVAKVSPSRQVRPVLAAAAALAAVIFIYLLVPGQSMGADALRSCLSAVLICGAWAVWGELPRRPSAARPRQVSCILIAALVMGAAIPALLMGVQAVASSSQVPTAASGATVASIALLVASCLGTAIWEEGLFRWLGMRAFAQGLSGRRNSFFASVVVSAALFSFVHQPAPLASPAGGATAWAIAAMRACQVFLFALCMSAVIGKDGTGILGAMALHATFDLACLAPALISLGPAAPIASLFVFVTDPMALGISLIPLLAAAVLSVRVLVRTQ